MKIHEYQAKEVLKKYGVSIPRGRVAETPEEAKAIAEELKVLPLVVKAQIHAGGRGKGGGIKVAHSVDEVGKLASEIIGMTLVTHQTGPSGRIVKKVLIEEAKEIERELYLAVVIDRSRECPVVIASSEGGMEIEEIAASAPEKILKEYIDGSLRPFQARRLTFRLGIEKSLVNKAAKIILALRLAMVTKLD